MYILDVILDSKTRVLDRVFSYSATKEEFLKAEIGARVAVPFGQGDRVRIGVVVDYREGESNIPLKNIIRLIDDCSLITEDLAALGRFLRKEYGARRIDIVKLMLPPGNFSDIEKRVEIREEILPREVKRSDWKYLPYIKSKVGESVSLETMQKTMGGSLYSMLKDFPDRLSINIKLKVREEKREEWVRAVDVSLVSNRAKRQLVVMDCLKDEDLPLKKLIDISKASRDIIRTMEKKGAIEVYERDKEYKSFPKFPLTPDQDRVFKEILRSKKNIFLLKGITGSGKTEVYLHLSEEILKEGRDVICLVPEISLTPQMIDRFEGRFGGNVAVLHSKLSVLSRENQWRRIQNGEVRIVVGARSAVFAPLKNLGLIILDEEHENTFKSQSGVRYDTFKVAEERIRIKNAKLILGSATPDVCNYYRASLFDIELLELNKRISGEKLDIEIVDLREELRNGNPSIISMKLYECINEALKNKEQVILFLNRKGYSGSLSCRDCGYTLKCSQCDVSMSYYKSKEKVKCGYCGTLKNVPEKCPECGSSRIGYFGLGTELVEEVINKLFPLARTKRMDFESTREKDAYEKIYRAMLNEEIDILIGTQMVSKGLDFPKVSLVGILLADVSLNLPDYKAQERTFQLITQVSGRAGRAKTKGRVIIQTYQPNHYAVQFAKDSDYEGFYRNELSLRKEFFYPPFSRLLLVGFKGEDREKVRKVSIDFFHRVRTIAKDFKGKSFGPVPAFVEWIKGKYRFQILYKTIPNEFSVIREAVFGVFNEMKITGVDIFLDIDPISVI